MLFKKKTGYKNVRITNFVSVTKKRSRNKKRTRDENGLVTKS